MNWQKLSNPFVIALLRSPLHGLFDTHTMLITLTGRTSGKRYTFPVSYVYDGETIFVISRRDRTWWKNLRSGAQVTVLLRGHAWQARGASFTDTETVANDLLRIMQRIPDYQRLFHIKLDVTGQPEHPQDLTRLAEERVIVRMRGLTELSAYIEPYKEVHADVNHNDTENKRTLAAETLVAVGAGQRDQ